MKQGLSLYIIKPRKLAPWQRWCHALETKHRKAALKTLREENTDLEFFAIFQVGRHWYTIGGQIGKNIKLSKPGTLNHLHKQKKAECLEFIAHGDFSYLLQR